MNLPEILKPVKNELENVRHELENQLKEISDKHTDGLSYKFYVKNIIDHIFDKPGKMLRPALVIVSAGTVDKDFNKTNHSALISLAAAVEMIHAASLIHDDVIDESDKRRFNISLNGKYGNKIAILAGDILYSQVFKLLLNLPIDDTSIKFKVFDLFCDVTQQMCIGELGQFKILSKNEKAGIDDYLSILNGKTASLMSACCSTGVILTGADDYKVKMLADFGESYGMAFQLADDLSDNDAVFDSTSRIEEQRDLYIKKARTALAGLNKSESSEILHNLCNLI